MSEIYARVAAVLDTGINEIAHAELYVPLESNRRARLMSMTISGSTRVSVLGRGGDILSGASFGESRGLPMRDGSAIPYSQAHARTKVTTAPAEVIQGGQWFSADGVSGLVEFSAPVILGPGTGMLVRSNRDGERLECSFLWHEVSIDAVPE